MTTEHESLSPLGVALVTVQWVRENWLPLAAWAGVLASGYLAEFLAVFNIPVSITSTTVLGALPVLAGAAIVFVMAMAAYLLLPLIPLWLPDGNGRSLLDGHVVSKGRPKALNPYRTTDLFRRWMAVYVPFAGCVVGAVFYGSWQHQASGALLVGIVACAGAIAAYAFEPARRRARAWHNNRAIFYVVMGGATLLQVSGTLVVLKAVLTLTPDSTWRSIAHAVVIVLYMIVLVPLAQFLVAERLRSGWTPDRMKGVVLIVLVMATVPLISRPLGAHVAGIVLRAKDPAGDPCVVAIASGRAELRGWTDLSTNPKDAPRQSVRLPFASLIDATYYVKRDERGPTFSIPKDQVSHLASCPNEPAKTEVISTGAVPAKGMPVPEGVGSGSPVLPFSALIVSLFSVAVAVRSHRRAHRPLVTARVTTHFATGQGVALNLFVENTGNRPARDIRFVVEEGDLEAAREGCSVPLAQAVLRIFERNPVIPVLANGRQATNSFGHLGTSGCWKAGSWLPITIVYYDFDGKRFAESSRLLLADDAGFAQGSWEPSSAV